MTRLRNRGREKLNLSKILSYHLKFKVYIKASPTMFTHSKTYFRYQLEYDKELDNFFVDIRKASSVE